MKKPELDYESAVLPDILNALIRTEELEKESIRLKSLIEMNDLSWMANISEFKRSMKRLSEHEKDLHVKIKSMKEDFVETVNILRNKADNEDFDKLKKIVDAWPIHEYISKKEFLRMIEKIQEDRRKLRRY